MTSPASAPPKTSSSRGEETETWVARFQFTVVGVASSLSSLMGGLCGGGCCCCDCGCGGSSSLYSVERAEDS